MDSGKGGAICRRGYAIARFRSVPERAVARDLRPTVARLTACGSGRWFAPCLLSAGDRLLEHGHLEPIAVHDLALVRIVVLVGHLTLFRLGPPVPAPPA